MLLRREISSHDEASAVRGLPGDADSYSPARTALEYPHQWLPLLASLNGAVVPDSFGASVAGFVASQLAGRTGAEQGNAVFDVRD